MTTLCVESMSPLKVKLPSHPGSVRSSHSLRARLSTHSETTMVSSSTVQSQHGLTPTISAWPATTCQVSSARELKNLLTLWTLWTLNQFYPVDTLQSRSSPSPFQPTSPAISLTTQSHASTSHLSSQLPAKQVSNSERLPLTMMMSKSQDSASKSSTLWVRRSMRILAFLRTKVKPKTSAWPMTTLPTLNRLVMSR